MSALLTILLVAVLGASLAHAGAKLTINENAMIDLGARVQTYYLNMGDIVGDDDDVERWDMFRVRRARLRLTMVVNEHMTAFIQTDVSGASAGSIGQNMQAIDAWVNAKYNSWLQLYMGLNMAPALRQNLTSSGAMMAVDRPGMNYKVISWGIRSMYGFNTATLSGTSGGAQVPGSVRDLGATLFGSGPIGENVHLKYYAGMYNGLGRTSRLAPPETWEGDDTERYTGRVQVNFGDPEAGYYNSSTYVGRKNTIGIGASIDMQSDVAGTFEEPGDYMLFSVDGFIEKELGEGAITAEVGYLQLDLDDGAPDVEGTGIYGQVGYLFQEKWQPWFLYETWSSDADNDDGSYNLWRLGLTYFLAGHNANIKVGYEQVSTDYALPWGVDEDSISSFIVGFFTTY
ncbi:MAG: porin [Candidatus Krumholzibacteriia bacterium]